MSEKSELLGKRADGIVFSPGQVGQQTIKAIQDAKDNPDLLHWGVPQLDDHFVMMRHSRFIGLLGDTGMGKSTLMKILLNNVAGQLKDDEIAVHFTWEESVEDFGMSMLAPTALVAVGSLFHGTTTEKEMQRVLEQAGKLSGKPLWVVGHSDMSDKRRPRMTITDVELVMEYLVDVQKKKIRLATFDYLQRINTNDTKQDDVRLSFVQIVDRIKDIALQYKPVVVVASQIKRGVQARKWRQPQIHDAQETSNFEQTADGMVSVWMPYKSDNWTNGESVIEKKNVTDTAVSVSPDLLMIETIKQKKRKAPELRAVDLLPEYSRIVAYGKAATERKFIQESL